MIMMETDTCTIADVLMEIHDRQCVFLKTDTMEIVNPMDYLKKYLPKNPTVEDYEKLPSKKSLNIYPLPSYEFIGHKNIMSEFTHNIYDNKEARKELFNILRNHDYMDKFYECLKKYNLYDDYRYYASDYYNFVFKKWCLKYNIKIG